MKADIDGAFEGFGRIRTPDALRAKERVHSHASGIWLAHSAAMC